MVGMVVRITRSWQVLMAVMVMAATILFEIETYGPDIDGRTPGLADTIQMFAVEALVMGAFAVAAIGLFRWHKFGWWLSIALDGLLGLAAASMIVGDFSGRFMATQAGREAFRGDLIIHATLLLICVGAIGFLLLARKRLLIKRPLTPRQLNSFQ
jgi:hypothetical protein